MTVESAFDRKRTVFLDSAPVIYALGIRSPWSQKATHAIGFCIDHGIRLLSSPVTVAECLAGEPDPVKQRRFVDFLLHSSDIDFEPIDKMASIQAGLIRQRCGWKLPDSLQMSFALRYGCDAFLTNDAGFKAGGFAIETILLSDLE